MRRRAQCPLCGGPMEIRSARCQNCVPPRAYDKQVLSSDERADFGVIVTFRNDAGEQLTLHRFGTPKQALAACCDAAAADDEAYRVVAVSSPQSIYTDLQGSRTDGQTRGQEIRALGAIGRRWMIHRHPVTAPVGLNLRHQVRPTKDGGALTLEGEISVAAQVERHNAVMGARAQTTICGVYGCEWKHEGTAADGREAFVAHRAADHPTLAKIKARAGMRGRPAKWTRDAIMAAVQARAAELGRPPSQSHMPSSVVSASVREFGSWASAVQCAGFPRPASGRAPVRAVVPLAEVAKPEVALSEPGDSTGSAGTEAARQAPAAPGSLSRHESVAGFLASTVTRAELERMLDAARARGDRFRTEAARAEGEAVTIMYALALGEAA